MPDLDGAVVTPAAASPADAPASPPAGSESGGDDQRQPTQEDLDKLRASLQSTYDKKLSAADKEIARRNAVISELQMQAENLKHRLEAPDAVLQPAESVEYWQRVAAQAEATSRTEQRIHRDLEQFYKDTGVFIERGDGRLDVSSETAYRRSLQAIYQEVMAAKNPQGSKGQDLDTLRKELREEILKELGVDRMDGGRSGGSGRQTRNFTQAQISDPKFYKEHREAILAAYGRGELDHLSRTNARAG